MNTDKMKSSKLIKLLRDCGVLGEPLHDENSRYEAPLR